MQPCRFCLLAALFLAMASGACRSLPRDHTGNEVQPVTLTRLEDRVRVAIGGNLFTEYVFKGAPRPYLFPILGPNGKAMTRSYPMRQVAGETSDHVHHRSLWFGHDLVNGARFWSEGANTGTQVQEELLEATSGKKQGVLRTRNSWRNKDAIIATDERTIRFGGNDRLKVLDYEITLRATQGPVKFGDTKEGTMALRIADSMRLAGGQGHIVNSEGMRDGDTWGKRAKWCDYHGPVEGKAVGIAIFDHPKNPRYPTWWHVRDYGLFAANAFGKHDFERLSDRASGDLEIPAGQSVTFRYRFVFHEGDEKQGRVAELFDEWAARP